MPQSLTRLWVHLIWSTKNRYPFLRHPEIQTQLHKYLNATCTHLKCPPVVVGGIEDHVHVLCGLSKTMSVSELVEQLKKSSSKWIKTLADHDENLNRFYWQKGYGAFSVSQSNLEQVKSYVEKQEQHHTKISFQDELRQLVKRHLIEFDERYLWD